MTRRGTLLRNIAIGVAAFVVASVGITILVVQTDWFRSYVKQKIVTSTEEGTGGKVDIGSFAFDWRHLEAIVTDFVIHGNEPPGSPPWIRVARVQLDLRLFTSLKHLLDLSYLAVDRPQANVIVFPDGHTNIPTPKPTPASNTTALESVVDLAVGHFELTNGLLVFNSEKQPLSVRGDNFRAQLWYNVLKQGYQGQISLQPLYVISGRNSPVRFTVTLPLALERDRIDLHNARISTPASDIVINGSLANLRDPKTTAHIAGHIAIADLKAMGNLPLEIDPRRRLPSIVGLDANATIAGNAIQVTSLKLDLGQSHIDASGALQDPQGNGSLVFDARLALGELGRLANVTARPDGTITLNGTAKLDRNNNYQLTGNLAGKNVSFQAGAQRIAGVSLASEVHFDPHRLSLDALHVMAFGGELDGNASLTDFARYNVSANLRHLDLRTAAHTAGETNFNYSGVASGPISAEGDTKTPVTRSMTAHARISIVPGRQGIPLSGHLNADYLGASDNLALATSYLALPHTRVTLSGSLGKRLDIALTTHDLNDLYATLPPSSRPQVSLDAGSTASITGAVTGSLTSPHIGVHLSVNRFSVEQRHFDALALDAIASSAGAAVSNGSLTRGTMQASFSGSVGLRDWKALPNNPLSAAASIRNGDLADVMALAGQPGQDYSGAFAATANVSGTVGNPRGGVSLDATNGTIQAEPFDRIQAQVNMADRLISVPTAYIAAGPARISFTADFHHPRDSFSTGQLNAHVQTSRLNLAQLHTLQKQMPNTSGDLQLKADVSGTLSEKEFLLTAVNGDASAHGLRVDGQNYGDFNAAAHSEQRSVTYNLSSNFAGSKVSVNGTTKLERDYPTTADASIASLPIERVLTITKSAIPAKGMLTATAHFSGTISNPQGNADVNLTNAVLHDEPIDRVQGSITYLAQSIDVPKLEVTSGPARIDLTAKYDHPAGNLQAGDLQFRINSSHIDLARIRNVQTFRQGLAGTLQIDASGAATIKPAGRRVAFRQLEANIAATGIAVQGRDFGGLTLTANTTGGRVNFKLDSNLAGADIHGHGDAEPTGDYPVDAELTFRNVKWTPLQALLGTATEPPSFEAVADGQASINGPVGKTGDLRGSVKLTRLNLSSIPSRGSFARQVAMQNQGPISVTLDRGAARIDSFHLTGSDTDIQVHGSASVDGSALDLTLDANANLSVLKQLDRDIVSSGQIVVAATVRGDTSRPLLNGQMELRNASLNYTEIPNGISNANGVVRFNGDSASIQNLTAESGGGTVKLGGFVAYRDTLHFGLKANAANVRVRVQEGMSAVFDAKVNLSGTMQSSTASGTVTVDRVTYAPQSDIGSMLSKAPPDVESAAAPSPLLDNMKLDIHVRTSESVALRSALAEGLQADADLRLRGTASQPGLLGRVTITEGKLVFFNSTYTVNTGSISFFNPVRIEPILNLDLETETKGVDVDLKVTGPIDNMKLSYTSDPPLQFQEIVELLASGKTPTSDPTILANQPPDPPQTFTQMGESAVVSQALADPVAGRLQRVFGVSQLKIDPTFSSGSALPQAQLTLQQHVASNITFTYATAVNAPNTEIIRVDWTLNPQWSAIGLRDQNGILSVKLNYKKRFR